MATKDEELAGGCFAKAMPTEPMFVLLARDPQAPSRVEQWATQRQTEINSGVRSEDDRAQVNEAFACALAMRKWRAENEGAWRV